MASGSVFFSGEIFSNISKARALSRAANFPSPLARAEAAKRMKPSTIHVAPWLYWPPFSRTPGG